MQSGKSWFNGTLFLKNTTRFWPIWGLYLVIWVFAFPVNLLVSGIHAWSFASSAVLSYTMALGLPLAVLFSILAAMAVWSYLYNSRSVGLMHSLPIRREGLFFTNYLSGMAFFVGPNIAIFLLTLLAEVVCGSVNMQSLCVWLASVTLMELFFFSFATFCAMFTGHILCLPAFYGILNVLAISLVWLLDAALSGFVFGYTAVEGLSAIAEWLTPAWKLHHNLWISTSGGQPWLVGLGYILIYAFLGLVLAALALAVYRRREMERAGDVVTVSWVRPIFRYGAAFCCALAFGSLLFEIFRYALPNTAWTLLFFMLLCGAAGCFAAQMLLEKTFRVFHAWKGCVVFLCVLVVLTCVMEFDLTGYERRVPNPDKVDGVYIRAISSMPYDSANNFNLGTDDPEIIQAVVDLHQTVVRSKRECESLDPLDGYRWEDTSMGYSVQTHAVNGLYLTYFMKDGSIINRNYYYCIPINQELLADPSSPAAKINALINMPQVSLYSYGLENVSADRVVELSLTELCRYDEAAGCWVYQNVQLPQECLKEVYQAVLDDMAAGNLGRRYLLNDQERKENCYRCNLDVTFYWNDSSDSAPNTAAAEGVSQPADREAASTIEMPPDRGVGSITIGLEASAQNTLAALERAGVLKDGWTLLTHAQYEQMDPEEWNYYEDIQYWEYGGNGTYTVPTQDVVEEPPEVTPETAPD